MKVHLVDGTYELFRQHFGQAARHRTVSPTAAAAGVLASTLQLVADGATHVAVASDHVIESFRNELWPGYKTGEGMLPELLEQIPLMERALTAAGFTVWAMVEFEADDALAAAARRAAADPRVEQVRILTPDKDLAQCVIADRVVQVDRRHGVTIDADGVVAKYGVAPASIPDYLALVGDSADGYPGLPGWGAKSAAAVLSRWGHLERIPDDPAVWEVTVRGAANLAATLRTGRELAMLFRRLAILGDDPHAGGPETGEVDDWAWRGPTAELDAVAAALGAPELAERARRLR